jgi:hypothetical protein
MGAPGTSKIPKTTQAPAIHGAPEPTSDLSTRAKRFERRRGRKEVGPYPVLHDGLEPDELGDAVVLGGGEPRLERRSADSCAMFNMTSAYAFLSASTCAKEEPVRPRGGRTVSAAVGFRERNFTWEAAISENLSGEEREGARWLLLVLWCCGARQLEWGGGRVWRGNAMGVRGSRHGPRGARFSTC